LVSWISHSDASYPPAIHNAFAATLQGAHSQRHAFVFGRPKWLHAAGVAAVFQRVARPPLPIGAAIADDAREFSFVPTWHDALPSVVSNFYFTITYRLAFTGKISTIVVAIILTVTVTHTRAGFFVLGDSSDGTKFARPI